MNGRITYGGFRGNVNMQKTRSAGNIAAYRNAYVKMRGKFLVN